MSNEQMTTSEILNEQNQIAGTIHQISQGDKVAIVDGKLYTLQPTSPVYAWAIHND